MPCSLRRKAIARQYIIWVCIFLFTLLHTQQLYSNGEPIDQTLDFSQLVWDKATKLGSGSYGDVYWVPCEGTVNNAVVIKRHFQMNQLESVKNPPREIAILEDIKRQGGSVWLPQYRGAQYQAVYTNKGIKNFWFHAMEYFPKDLYSLLSTAKKKSISLSEEFIKKIVLMILKGIYDLHKLGYIHRDLKPENILLSERPSVILQQPMDISFKLVISDLGLATALLNLESCKQTGSPNIGTRYYRPPEVCEREEKQFYGRCTDVWSVGVIFAEFVIGENPFQCFYKQEERLLASKERANPITSREVLFNVFNKHFDNDLMRYSTEYSHLWERHFGALPMTASSLYKMIFGDFVPLHNESPCNSRLSKEGFVILAKMLEKDPMKRVLLKDLLDDPYWPTLTQDIYGTEENPVGADWSVPDGELIGGEWLFIDRSEVPTEPDGDMMNLNSSVELPPTAP